MKQFTVLTLFPEMFNNFLTTSIIEKALAKKLIAINIVNLRDYSVGKHHQVDDYQYGGGEGMVLMIEPLVKAIKAHQTKNSITILLSPQGKQYRQQQAQQLAKQEQDLILICGHYEGFDERILHYVDYELSIGDYVLTGGELASMIVIDSVARLCSDVINAQSHLNDSFTNNLLDYPVYTKPVAYDGHLVPEVLLSGHHQNIAQWREYEALKKTWLKRPDLLLKMTLTPQQEILLTKIKNEK
ncbi:MULTISPECIES: tRNA (guanosine(37)-N1)-methyltransferase TrmD [Spiroplasma]|uniref:tRNA (guanosine(37)-N1)-methyltransferase TrmD n=1 Tax=Spiroplasma TaxID=2132 RepID=UPI0018DD75D1|nr:MULTISPECIES: tRNA (guanosine(37)-N1)-methyltransferase TrmD [Spiroplasma]MBH8622368.1 tRNA (guanosine(37)-N1)-methyltransferase TrmD [Spiroplasma sp. hyd1]UNF61584.1 tRNA (guanosine(37)-N1)-methyltransferase TrmD [Spiroplasma poulsonii]